MSIAYWRRRILVALWAKLRKRPSWRYTRWAFVYFDRWGVNWDTEIGHLGHTEVCWLWPWMRRKLNTTKRFHDLACLGTFVTLQEVKDFWIGYYTAEAIASRWEMGNYEA